MIIFEKQKAHYESQSSKDAISYIQDHHQIESLWALYLISPADLSLTD